MDSASWLITYCSHLGQVCISMSLSNTVSHTVFTEDGQGQLKYVGRFTWNLWESF